MNLPRDVANFLSASGGKQIVYLKDYVDLRRFCVDALKWADEDDSLMPELGDEEDFVFFANPKGVLLAPNIAACFRDERNPEYNPEIAEQEGAELFYIPSTCCTMPCSTAYCRRLLFLSGMAGGCCTRTGIS